jgi:hypothetical protein
MTFDKFVRHDWTKVIAIILTMVGLALAAEHRQTLNEDAIAANVAAVKVIKDHQDKMDEVISALQMNQIRVVTILDGIDKRHTIEDQKRIR